MAISPYPSVSTAHDQALDQQKAQEQKINEDDTSLFKMAWDLRGEHEIYDYQRLTFETDDNFKMSELGEEFDKNTKYVKDALVEANPSSREEYDYLVDKYTKLEQDISKYQQQGLKYLGANILASMLDPTSAAISIGTGFSGLGYKLGKGTLAAVTAETVLSESAIAGSKLAFNPTYDSDDAVLDMALSPLGALPVFIGEAVSPIVRRNRENNRVILDNLFNQYSAIQRGETDVVTEARVNNTDDYQTAILKTRFDRTAEVLRTDNEALKADVHKVYEDAVGSHKDVQGQGETVDLAVFQMTDSLVPRFNHYARTAFRKIMKEQGYSKLSRVFSAEDMQKAMGTDKP